MARRPLIIGGYPFSLNHENCLDLDGATEEMRNATNTPVGIGNTWTIALWYRGPGSYGSATESIIGIGPSSGAINLITINMLGTSGNEPIRISINNSAGTTFKQYVYNNQLLGTGWNHLVTTWDGTSLLFYRDSVLRPPDALSTDNPGTMTSTDRRFSVGTSLVGVNNIDGKFHSLALWDVALPASDIVTLYNAGDGSTFHAGNIQTPHIVQYWLFGYTTTDLFHNEIGSYDLGANAVDLDATDIVADAP